MSEFQVHEIAFPPRDETLDDAAQKIVAAVKGAA